MAAQIHGGPGGAGCRRQPANPAVPQPRGATGGWPRVLGPAGGWACEGQRSDARAAGSGRHHTPLLVAATCRTPPPAVAVPLTPAPRPAHPHPPQLWDQARSGEGGDGLSAVDGLWLAGFLAWAPLLLWLSLRRPKAYLRLRTPLVLLSRLHRSLTCEWYGQAGGHACEAAAGRSELAVVVLQRCTRAAASTRQALAGPLPPNASHTMHAALHSRCPQSCAGRACSAERRWVLAGQLGASPGKPSSACCCGG